MTSNRSECSHDRYVLDEETFRCLDCDFTHPHPRTQEERFALMRKLIEQSGDRKANPK